MYLVLEVDGRVEVGDLGVDGLAENLALDVVDELAHFYRPLAAPSNRIVQNCAHTKDLIGGAKRRCAAKATASCRQISWCTPKELRRATNRHGE
jgi:hypothetical protein